MCAIGMTLMWMSSARLYLFACCICLQATVLWRQESGANDALATPHPRFDLIKKHYPTYFHGKVWCYRSVWVGFGSVRLGAVRFGSVRFGSVRFGSVRFGSVWFGSVRFGSVRFGSVRFGSVRFGSVRFGPVRFDSVRSGSVRFGAVRFHGKIEVRTKIKTYLVKALH